MQFMTILCLIASVFVSSLMAQGNNNTCHLCELVVNDVFALHPGGVVNVPDAQLMTELGNECDKYLANMPQQDQGCHQWLTQNGASFIAAMRMYTNAYQVCHAPPASVC